MIYCLERVTLKNTFTEKLLLACGLTCIPSYDHKIGTTSAGTTYLSPEVAPFADQFEKAIVVSMDEWDRLRAAYPDAFCKRLYGRLMMCAFVVPVGTFIQPCNVNFHGEYVAATWINPRFKKPNSVVEV